MNRVAKNMVQWWKEDCNIRKNSKNVVCDGSKSFKAKKSPYKKNWKNFGGKNSHRWPQNKLFEKHCTWVQWILDKSKGDKITTFHVLDRDPSPPKVQIQTDRHTCRDFLFFLFFLVCILYLGMVDLGGFSEQNSFSLPHINWGKALLIVCMVLIFYCLMKNSFVRLT